MICLTIPDNVYELLRDVAKDVIRGTTTDVSLVPANVLDWNRADVVDCLSYHVSQLSDQQYRVEQVSLDERKTYMSHIPGMNAYCARVETHSRRRRHFALAPYPNPLQWA
jgi:hypothetical protein